MSLWKGTKKVQIQDSTFPLLQYSMIQEIKTDITLVADAPQNSTSVTVSSGHGFVIGEIITFFEASILEQVEVTGVASDVISFGLPLSVAFTSANCQVVRGDRRLNFNAAAGFDILFKLRQSVVPINIYGAKILMFHSAQGDDGKFGGIAALTNGAYFRKLNQRIFNLQLYKTNFDFKRVGAIVEYPDKAPAGNYSTEITWDLQAAFGQVLRFNPLTNDYLLLRLQDDFSGLLKFEISLLGKADV